MTAFRSRPTIAICLMTGTAVSISLAGLVWAQAPAENWPFDEHNQPSTAQSASPPKSAVQKRLEELYQRDHRPLPDYMQQDGGGEQAAPANSAAPGSQGAPVASDPRAQRIQRDSAGDIAGNRAPATIRLLPESGQGHSDSDANGRRSSVQRVASRAGPSTTGKRCATGSAALVRPHQPVPQINVRRAATDAGSKLCAAQHGCQ
jgi:hypothetical protein